MDVATKIAAALGPKGWLTDDVEMFQTDWLKHHSHKPLGVARPASTSEVATVMRIAHAAGVRVTPQGGNTSLCAAAVPGHEGSIILSLSRMNSIEIIDEVNFTVTVDAGVVLATLHDKLADRDLMFPMHLGAEGSAQIGGLISTNAGGSHALRYGMMQDLVLGLEVVLPDGTIWDGARALTKDNAGYQLRRLFCGAEGTLGIITKAVLRSFPRMRKQATALLAVPDFETAVILGAGLRNTMGEFISALEFFSETGLELALKHVKGLSYPLETRSEAYVLVELSTASIHVPLDVMLEDALALAFEAETVLDGTIAANDAQRAEIWKLREEIPEGQRLEGLQIKHDISVPVSGLGRFINEMCQQLSAMLPGIRINPFGHLGDGNIHFNLTPPVGQVDFGTVEKNLSHEIYQQVEKAGGSFAAEHGLGRTKTKYANLLRSPVERALMAKIKTAIDPTNILNPGVIHELSTVTHKPARVVK